MVLEQGASTLDPMAANGESIVAARAKQRLASVPLYMTLANLDDAELDRCQAVAKAKSAWVEWENTRERKLQCLLAIEWDDEEQHQQVAMVPHGGLQLSISSESSAPRTTRGPAAQLPPGPDVNNLVDIVALHSDLMVQQQARWVLKDSGLHLNDRVHQT